MTTARTCSVTGLRLISDPGAYGFHVGKNDYPALSGAPRDAAAKWRQAWGRYDVPGQTFYVAETRSAAYAEVLSGFKRANGATDTLTKDAEFAGLSLEEYIEEIAREWSERDFMGLGAIPAGWRYDRGLIPVVLPDPGWLVDVEHPDSISVIEGAIGPLLASFNVTHLTTGTLRSEERAVTTRIAEHLHGLTLDTGTTPLGVHFGSKHGAAWCKAIWLDHPEARDVLTLAAEPILVTDDDLKTAADRFRIRVF
ncbi:hypothetical protein [Microbacterium sp. K2]|uniref:hypothetical protein n=1 Tax=Microbacterium sp. K2 TaxID=3391827 RepID=UPI003ED92F0D